MPAFDFTGVDFSLKQNIPFGNLISKRDPFCEFNYFFCVQRTTATGKLTIQFFYFTMFLICSKIKKLHGLICDRITQGMLCGLFAIMFYFIFVALGLFNSIF